VTRPARLWPPAPSAARQLAHRLRPVVIVGLGTNGRVTTQQVQPLMAIVRAKREVTLVNTLVPLPYEQGTNNVPADAARTYPNVFLANWNKVISGHVNLLRPDGIHPLYAGSGVPYDVPPALSNRHHRGKDQHPVFRTDRGSTQRRSVVPIPRAIRLQGNCATPHCTIRTAAPEELRPLWSRSVHETIEMCVSIRNELVGQRTSCGRFPMHGPGRCPGRPGVPSSGRAGT
jgi:hypothetical protein